MSTARDPRRRRQLGLTLLEVVVSLAILSLLSTAIYSIIIGAVDATASLAAIESENRRINAFLEQSRSAFAHFPQGASAELKIIESEPLRQELTLRGVTNAFIWGPQGSWEQPAVTLTPRPWPESRLKTLTNTSASTTPPRHSSLAMSVPDFFRTNPDGTPLHDSPLQSPTGNQLTEPDEKGRFWMDLIPDVQSVTWRFWDPSAKKWLDHSGPTRPILVEIQILLPGRTHPVRAVFATS